MLVVLYISTMLTFKLVVAMIAEFHSLVILHCNTLLVEIIIQKVPGLISQCLRTRLIIKVFTTCIEYMVLVVGERERANLVIPMSQFFYIHVYIFISIRRCHTYRNVLREFQLYATTAPLCLVPRPATRLLRSRIAHARHQC